MFKIRPKPQIKDKRLEQRLERLASKEDITRIEETVRQSRRLVILSRLSPRQLRKLKGIVARQRNRDEAQK